MYIASQTCDWKFPIHHGVSITWWKAYYYYGTIVSDNCENKSTILKTLHVLGKYEKLGLRINVKSLSTLPLNGSVFPSEFIHDPTHPVALNYPAVSYDIVNSSTNHNGDIARMAQRSNINGEDNASGDDIFNNSDSDDDCCGND